MADGGLRRFIAAGGLQQSGRQSFATVGGHPTVGPPLVCYRWPAHYSVVGGPPPASHRGWTSSGGPPVVSYRWPTYCSVFGGPPPACHRGWTSSGGPPVASYSWPTHCSVVGGPPPASHLWRKSTGGPPLARRPFATMGGKRRWATGGLLPSARRYTRAGWATGRYEPLSRQPTSSATCVDLSSSWSEDFILWGCVYILKL